MVKLSGEFSRSDVLEYISRSSRYGNLGSFVGAGFSKAVLQTEWGTMGLSWGDLLGAVAQKLGVNYDEIDKEGKSYPEIASCVCETYSRAEEVDYGESVSEFKRQIAAQTSWYPNREQRDKYSVLFRRLGCAWIITTNYDLIIESLLAGSSIPLGPNDSLIAQQDLVPIYHLHGIRTNPEEIIIVQEDYVGLFRPTEYRQLKLALMIKESTMLILGYGLGDVNVLTALDWSKNVFSGGRESYPNEVIQVVRRENPSEQPYRDKNNIVVLEVAGILEFLSEIADVHEEMEKKAQEQKQELKDLAAELDDPQHSMVEKFLDEQDYREKVLAVLAKFPHDLVSGFVSFLNACIDEAWKRSSEDGAFEAYANNLNMLLDILETFKVEQIPPALFQTVAYAMDRLASHIGNDLGQSYSAKRVWDQRKSNLSREMVDELKNFASPHMFYLDLYILVRDL